MGFIEDQGKPPKVSNGRVGSVTSHNSAGGVTAGSIGTVNQNTILPTLVRGPLLNKFKDKFAKGARLYRALLMASTDNEIDGICNDLDKWHDETATWLQADVGEWASERFLFRMGPVMTWTGPGSLKPETIAKRSDYINGVYPLLQNLDQIMREPSIYPQGVTKRRK